MASVLRGQARNQALLFVRQRPGPGGDADHLRAVREARMPALPQDSTQAPAILESKGCKRKQEESVQVGTRGKPCANGTVFLSYISVPRR